MLRSLGAASYPRLPWHRKMFSYEFRNWRMEPSNAPEQLQALEPACQGLPWRRGTAKCFKPWCSLVKAYLGLPWHRKMLQALERTVAPQNVFLWVSKLTDGRLCSGAAASLGAALSRLTLAYRGTAKWFLLGFEADGWTPQMLRSALSLGTALPRSTLTYRGTAKCFLCVSKLTDGHLKCSGAAPSCCILSEQNEP